MKRIIVVAIICCLVILACQRRSIPAAEPSASLPSSPIKPVLNDSVATALTAGKLIYETKCIKCHEAKPIGNWNQDQWKVILRSMIRKTKLDEIAAAQVTAYTMANAKK